MCDCIHGESGRSQSAAVGKTHEESHEGTHEKSHSKRSSDRANDMKKEQSMGSNKERSNDKNTGNTNHTKSPRQEIKSPRTSPRVDKINSVRMGASNGFNVVKYVSLKNINSHVRDNNKYESAINSM